MAAQQQNVNLLLVTRNSSIAENLYPALDANELNCGLRTVSPSKRVLDSIRRLDANSSDTIPDLILFDFTAATEKNFELGKAIACGPKRTPIPVVFLTSLESEQLLEDMSLHCCDTQMFAPMLLDRFLMKMLEHPHQHFMRALTLIYDLGPILVRLPAANHIGPEDRTALSA